MNGQAFLYFLEEKLFKCVKRIEKGDVWSPEFLLEEVQ